MTVRNRPSYNCRMDTPSETPMSDPTPPTPPQPTPPSGDLRPPLAGDRTPRPGPPRENAPRRPFPRGDRPRPDGSKPQDLTPRDFDAARVNTRDLDRSIEDELNAALAGFDVTGTVAKAEGSHARGADAPRSPGKKRGTVVGLHGKDVFVEVPGGRGQGVLPVLQFEGKPPSVGDTVEFDIEGYDAANGLLKLTMTGAAQVVHDWSGLLVGMVVEAKITGVNKNKTGVSVEVNGIKGFMPASQLELHRVENLDDYINQRHKVEVTEVNPDERNLIVSRRNILERDREQLREQFWAKVEEGQVMTGIVRSVKPFGAFVDLGGADGLIPVSEMSWSRVEDPASVLSIGQKVEVKVHRLDRETRKIALSLKALLRSPWDDFAERHKVGARLIGKVTRIADFGAFVEVAPGIEGLLHVSELSTQRVRRVRDVVSEGQEITVQVQNIDPAARRMSLSLKAMTAEAEAADAAAEDAERDADEQGATDRMANRPVNPNLRGGIGSGR